MAKSRGRIEEAVRCFFHLSQAVGLIAAVLPRDDEPWIFVQGAVEDGPSRSPDRHTLWQIGSLTKTFTATLLARAVHRGVISLDSALQSFAPPGVQVPTYDTYNASVPIRFVDTATHTAGLPMDPRAVPPGGYSIQQMYEYLSLYTLAVEPGTSWNYSNLGFGLLANLLVRVEGSPDYAASVESLKKSARLTMPDTCLHLDAAQKERLAVGYSAPGVRAPLNTSTWPALDGSGALYSTLDDMVVWLSFNLGRRPSPEDDLLALTQRVYFNNGVQPMGLAWQKGLFSTPGQPFWSKGGSTNGFASFLAFSHPLQAGVVILTNSVYAYPQNLGIDILEILAGLPAD
jgi:CubicO group peptidase (beta-lactamase class C family)